MSMIFKWLKLAIATLLAAQGVMSACFDPIQVTCDINGFHVPAVIDTGAEISVMSASCAKRCHVSNLIDTKFSGKAIGVGTSDIIGGIDKLQIQMGPLSFQNKIRVLRESRCEFIIGLDILQRFKCDISLKERVLKLQVKKDQVRIPLSHSSYGMSDLHPSIVSSSLPEDESDIDEPQYVNSTEDDYDYYEDNDYYSLSDSELGVSMEGV